MPVCRCGAIDIHTHIVPFTFPSYMGAGSAPAGWPSMAAGACGHRNVMIADKVYRTVAEAAWNGESRLRDMQEMAVQAQVLSPMPELLSYWMEPKAASQLLRYLNDSIAAMVAEHPGRFHGLGAIPLQDMDAALRELEYVVRTLGLPGVEIGTNVGGKVIGDPSFAPFWEAVADLNAAVFVHPLRPTGMDRLVGPPALQQVLAFPVEAGLAAASLITGGVIARHPTLSVAFSHGAGALGALLPRLQQGWQANPTLREMLDSSPVELARRLYVDSLVYSDEAVAGLIEMYGDSQVMVGSDYPFRIRERDPVGRIQRLQLSPEQRESILGGNARRWLGLSGQTTTSSRQAGSAGG